MKVIFFNLSAFILTVILFFSCDSKRPDADSFEYSLSVYSIQADADVEILDGEKTVITAKTDENGEVNFESLNAVSNLEIKVCGGTVNLVSSNESVAWTGCSEAVFTPVEKETNSITVDFLSTFIVNYESQTSAQEWMDYLGVTTLSSPTLQTSLTDSTKRYLWLQGFSVIAENISQANGINPETQYSTEKLVNLIKDDLADDDIINGSTEKVFGTLNIDSAVLKNIIAEAIPEVSNSFSTSDLKEWTDSLAGSKAAFLGGSGSETDNEEPVITIEQPTEDNETVWGEVTIRAIADDNKQVATLDCTIIDPEDAPDIEDTVDEAFIFSGTFDSTLMSDGEVSLKCVASDGTNIAEKEFSVNISNSNKVNLKAFVTNELTDWNSVVVYDYDGEKIGTYSFEEEEEPQIGLAPGDYTFVFNGGFYKPVFLNDESIEFDSELSTNQVVLAGETTEVIATPLTTIREKLYSEFKGTMSPQDAVEKSFSLISQHIDSDFPLYIEPVSKNQLTENSKYYIVLAGLERLAVLVGERHDPALEPGAITIEQVLKAITDDIATDTKGVLDGGGTINQFNVDSYLFRYWYAIAVKLFLESDENLTGLGFSDLQTVINTIATDDSELFPEDEAPKKVTDQPPVISEKQFKHSFETEFQDYSLDNIIFANDSLFSVKFNALPDGSGDLVIDLVEMFGDVEVQSLTDVNDDGIYTAELTFTDGDDGEKTVGIRAVDNAENTGTATLQAVKDTVNPVISDLGNNLGSNVTTPLTVSYEVNELYVRDSLFCVVPSGETPSSWTSLSPAVESGDITVTDAMLTDDGAYTLYFRTVDKAGNETSQTKSLVFDREIPTATFTTVPEINENGFIQENAIEITIIATDNVTPESDLIHEMWTGVKWSENISETKNVWNMQQLSEQLYENKYRVTDLAGNRSADINVNFTVDTIDPVVSTNKTDLEGRAYRSDDVNLELNSTCNDTNLLKFEYSINSGETTAITAQVTPLTNNSALIEGSNTIVVNCTDKSGRFTETTITVVIDNTPPVASFLSVPGNSVPVCGIEKTIPISGEDNNSITKVKSWYQLNGGSDSVLFYDVLNASNEADIFYPNPADTVFSNYELYRNSINSVSFYLTMEDEAGNQSQPIVTDWFVDGKPPVGGIVLADSTIIAITPPNAQQFTLDELSAQGIDTLEEIRTWIYAKFSDIAKIYVYENNTFRGSFENSVFNSDGNGDNCMTYVYQVDDTHYYPVVVCPFSPVSDQFTARVIFEDACGNKGRLTECEEFDHYCVERFTNTNTPPLHITLSYTDKNTVKLNIAAEGANIVYCHVTGPDKDFDCLSQTGDQFFNTESWDEGTFDVVVRSKYESGFQESQVTDKFIVDRTPFSISIDLKNGRAYYLKEAPLLEYSVDIASGVKTLSFRLHDRSVNRRYAPGTYTCGSNGLCTINSYNKYIYRSGSSSGSFSLPISGLFGVDSGIYTKISYEVEPNFGETERGEVSITPVRLILSDDDDIKFSESGGKITFSESIISEKLETSDVKIFANNHYGLICRKNDHYFYKKRDSITEPSYSINFSYPNFSGSISFIKGISTYRWFRDDRDTGAFSWNCNNIDNCPDNFTRGCEEVGSLGTRCVANRGSSHWSDSGTFAWYGSDSCNCDAWDGHSQCLDYNCDYLRNMEYHSAGTYIVLYDNSPRPSKTVYLKDFIVTKAQNDCF